MQVETWKIEDVKPYENNPRKNDEAVEYVANSIREFGFQQPIVVDSEGVIIAGHTRYKAAHKLGLTEVPVVVADGLTQNQVDAYRLADNKVSEFADWDMEKLNIELSSIDWFETDMTQFGFMLDGVSEEENPYNTEINGLLYEPSDEMPSISELVDLDKMAELKDEISRSDVSEQEKEFLKLAAMRHLVFDYGKIADYYANASEEMRKLMEQSVLVIVDYDQALEQGYVRLRTALDDELELL